MNRLSWPDLLRKECIFQVNQFYESVLDSFMTSYYKQNKYRNNAVDEDIIIQLEKKIKKKLRDPQMLFQASNKYKEGKEEEDLNALEQKYFNDMSLEEFRKTFGKCKIEEKIKEMPEDEEEDDNEDDLGSPQIFESTKTYHNAVKQEEDYSAELKYEPRDGDSFSQQSQEANTSEKDSDEIDSTELLNCRITGVYKYNTLKYKSKDQKYEIDFTNTFIKCPEGEMFCELFSIETTKIDKDQLKTNR